MTFVGVRLSNFKSHKRSGWVPLAPLTLVVGPNNSGKSSLLDAILLFCQSVDDPGFRETVITSGPLVDLGGYADIVTDGKLSENVEISFRLDSGSVDSQLLDIGGETRFGGATELSVQLTLDRTANAIVACRVSLIRGRRLLLSVTREEDGFEVHGALAPRGKSVRVALNHFLPVVVVGEEDGDRDLSSFETALGVQRETWLWSEVLRNVRYLVPLRQPIPRYTSVGQSVSGDLGAGGENLVRALQDSERIGKRGTLLDEVNYWIGDRFSLFRHLEVKELAGTVRTLLARERGQVVNVANMGEGVGQLLPIIAAAVLARAGQTLLIEQPEIHLHPSAQADMGDLFVDSLRERRGSQFIVETHSEHLLLRIRHRVARGDIDPSDVSVLYVEKPGLRSHVRRLVINESGYFDHWPKGFFEEGYEESIRLAEASAKRSQQRE